MVPEIKFAVLINEDRKGHIKGSFRTRNDDVDLSKVASQFGGGGHPKASGFSIPGKLQAQMSYKIVTHDNVRKPLDFLSS
jgi:nanoRNase/pAp phosphatase (c-di-AMP/oligoRNAs hydrolase)